MTVQECVDSSLRKLGVIAPGETPSAEERAAGLAALNAMTSSWSDALAKSLAGSYASSIYSFSPLRTYLTLSDSLGVSAGWERAYVANLAVELALEFGRSVTAELAAIAGQAKAAVVTLPSPVI